MKALLMGLEVLTVHVKGYAGDHHHKQDFTIQSVFFCKGKFQKGPKSHEKLTQAVQLRAYQTLCNCAIQKEDERF